MDWHDHIREMARRWLLGSRPDGSLPPAMLMLLGNPDRYRQDEVEAVLGAPRRLGVFRLGTFAGQEIAYTTPRFGGPATAMYLEVAAMAGVRRVVALGYTGGLRPETAVGTAFVASEALGLDGTTGAYQRGSAIPVLTHETGAPREDRPRVWPADAVLTAALGRHLDAEGIAWTAGRMATIDAIMLEDDAMVAAVADAGCAALDMETACLYAVSARLGLAASSVHLDLGQPVPRRYQPREFAPAGLPARSRGRRPCLAGRLRAWRNPGRRAATRRRSWPDRPPYPSPCADCNGSTTVSPISAADQREVVADDQPSAGRLRATYR